MTQTPRFKRYRPLWLALESFLLLFLWGCAQSPQSLRTTSLPVSLVEPQGPAAEWRAMNRLSYGPTPTLMADIKSKAHPKEWALHQLDAARKASLEAPKLPSDLASINDSLPLIFDGARSEREARAAVPAGTRLNELVANERRFNFQEQTEALFYNRTQVNKAVAWRLASCSNDDVDSRCSPE